MLANADTHDTVGTDVACVIAHAAIVAMLLIPVHTVIINIVSDVVLANADAHDILDTDLVYVIAHAAFVAMLLIPIHIGVIDIVSDVVLAILILMMFTMFLIFFVIALRC